ncbi:hypothetical protein BFP76_03590 [Amylibacter kogurei]|uniref:TNase-like domain-containing protein n=1 Tax=Paramylibacter kogurei TaxID=1889778 RepID=A0A2G5K5L2_9RHOB|nr:thermonuclease family protein [Amylibacter kogurei]PIB24313.1 hypothetical protein BFP76_03590 [Amylibacter kogurei]
MLRHAFYRWRSGIYLWLGIAVFALVILPRIGDVVIGYLKPTTGCSITAIVDGDTISIDCENADETRARIIGLDTPELASECFDEWILAQRAKWFLRWRIWSANHIETQTQGRDKYRRQLVRVKIDGTDIATSMINARLARPYDGGRRAGWCDN